MLTKYLTALLLACLFGGVAMTCRNVPVPQQPAAPAAADSSCNDAFIALLEDTLFHSPEVEFEYISEYDMYFVKKMRRPRGSFGVIANSGFFLATYEADQQGRWKKNNCGEISGWSELDFQMIDLDFDGAPDLLLDASDGGIHGNHFAIVFRYDPSALSYRRDTTLELENLEADPVSQQIRSRHYSSIYGGNIKELYQWENGILVKKGEAVFQRFVDSSRLRWSENIEGHWFEHNLYTEHEQAWNKFINLFWPGR